MELNNKRRQLYTTHEVARLLGVTPITVIRWIDSGKFKCFTTVGGHRRIEHAELARFAQEYNLPWQGEEEVQFRKEFVVLAVDDEADVLMMIRDILSSLPEVRFIEAGNGFAAGAKLVEELPDLLFLDFLMPELDGFQFTQFARQDPRFKDMPIIAVSALRTPTDLAKMHEAGVTEIVSKPFTIQDIHNVVERYHRMKVIRQKAA